MDRGGGTTYFFHWVSNTCSNGYREMCNTNIIANVFVFQIDPGGKIPIETYIGAGGEDGSMGARTWNSVVSKRRPPLGGGDVICGSSLNRATVVEVVLW